MADDTSLWTFESLDRVGGHAATAEGGPRIVDTAAGRATEFDGVDDALFVDRHPLEGAKTFTWEAIFRPDGGAEEQRWMHLQEGASENRLLFEIRVVNGRWYFDSYLHSGEHRKALIDRDKLHPLLAWYHVAAVYDGREFRNYVNGVQENAAAVDFAPAGPGRASIGVRINRVNYFKGAIRAARFTPRALAPAEFMKIEGGWREVSFPTSDGGLVYGDLYGTGDRAVVLVHGGRFDKASWAEQAHGLSKSGYRALAIDLRGYGKSRGPGSHDVFSAPLHLDVLAAVRYLKDQGAKAVFAIGGSMGGWAAAEAIAEAPGSIGRLVMLGATPTRAEKLTGRTLFIMARNDASGDGLRLPGLQEQYAKVPGTKELIILDGDAHAQYLFATEHRERVMEEILRFLAAP